MIFLTLNLINLWLTDITNTRNHYIRRIYYIINIYQLFINSDFYLSDFYD